MDEVLLFESTSNATKKLENKVGFQQVQVHEVHPPSSQVQAPKLTRGTLMHTAGYCRSCTEPGSRVSFLSPASDSHVHT